MSAIAATGPATCRLPAADAAAGKSVLARTLTLPTRLGLNSRRHPAHGSKRPRCCAATRTRWEEDAWRNRSARFPPSACVGLAYASVMRHVAGPQRAPACRMMPTCGAQRRTAQPKLARSEASASTSVHVLPDARITTAGPIARRGLRNEAAHSRRVSGRVPRRRASFRWAEREASADMPVPFEATSELEQA
jgi:hypothetical protein